MPLTQANKHFQPQSNELDNQEEYYLSMLKSNRDKKLASMLDPLCPRIYRTTIKATNTVPRTPHETEIQRDSLSLRGSDHWRQKSQLGEVQQKEKSTKTS